MTNAAILQNAYVVYLRPQSLSRSKLRSMSLSQSRTALMPYSWSQARSGGRAKSWPRSQSESGPFKSQSFSRSKRDD